MEVWFYKGTPCSCHVVAKNKPFLSKEISRAVTAHPSPIARIRAPRGINKTCRPDATIFDPSLNPQISRTGTVLQTDVIRRHVLQRGIVIGTHPHSRSP